MQTALATTEDLVKTILTGLAGSSASSSGGGGYMGHIADARARLAQAAAEEELARVKLDISRPELGELEEWWNARLVKASATSRRCRSRSRVCGRARTGQNGA